MQIQANFFFSLPPTQKNFCANFFFSEKTLLDLQNRIIFVNFKFKHVEGMKKSFVLKLLSSATNPSNFKNFSMNYKIWSSGILCYNFIKICSTILEILAEKDQGGG